MPYSSAIFDKAIQRFLTTTKPQRILDIGAGAGKLGSMVRAVVPDAHIVAVEIDPDYVTRFRLAETYDEVLQFNCMNLCLIRISKLPTMLCSSATL
ncbi:MAG: methyltransferase [Verrucomicrobiaceae bacterium]|nr:methyltransferase [Verrucomicrobiaceae bacterium]